MVGLSFSQVHLADKIDHSGSTFEWLIELNCFHLFHGISLLQ
jgi:hypothetical protein